MNKLNCRRGYDVRSWVGFIRINVIEWCPLKLVCVVYPEMGRFSNDSFTNLPKLIRLDCHFLSRRYISSIELTIDDTTLSVSVSPDTPGSPPTPVLTGWNENVDMDFLNFYLADNLVENERYVLSMNFSGTLRSDGYGLYYDSYVGPDGKTRWVVGHEGHLGDMVELTKEIVVILSYQWLCPLLSSGPFFLTHLFSGSPSSVFFSQVHPFCPVSCKHCDPAIEIPTYV